MRLQAHHKVETATRINNSSSSSSRRGKVRTVSNRDFSDLNGHSSLHGTSRHSVTNSITLRDFPDFDKFGAQLEDVEMNASPQKG